MDRDEWRTVMAAIRTAARRIKSSWHRQPDFPDWLIAAMELWRAHHNQSLSWACDRSHYHGPFRPRKRTKDGRSLPSISQYSRRVKFESVRAILQLVDDQLSGRKSEESDVRYTDGKPLTVSPVSKDPDATTGHITGGFAKGYKLHAFVAKSRRILTWAVASLHVAEQSVAMALLPSLKPCPGALNMADSNYDSAPLHKGMAATNTGRLLTPLKAQQRVKPTGHHPVTLRQMGPQRREAVKVWKEQPDLARYVLKDRNNIEGVFSVLTVACGLSLPPHVRRIERVRRWVGLKIILYHARLIVQDRRAAG